MSVESAKAFMERMKTDEVFREKIGRAKDREARFKILSDAGFQFSSADFKKASAPLDEDFLEGISAANCRACEEWLMGDVPFYCTAGQ